MANKGWLCDATVIAGISMLGWGMWMISPAHGTIAVGGILLMLGLYGATR